MRWSTAVDIGHESDWFATFYIIALGEFIYLIVVGSYAAVGLNEPLLCAFWTVVITFCLNWLYAHADGALDTTHPPASLDLHCFSLSIDSPTAHW
jgi:low temperature requirement protein LtrA